MTTKKQSQPKHRVIDWQKQYSAHGALVLVQPKARSTKTFMPIDSITFPNLTLGQFIRKSARRSLKKLKFILFD